MLYVGDWPEVFAVCCPIHPDVHGTVHQTLEFAERELNLHETLDKCKEGRVVTYRRVTEDGSEG